MFDWLKKLIPNFRPDNKTTDRADQLAKQGMTTITCRNCGKTFILPEDVQHWPDYCQECRAKYHPVEIITRKCRGCGKAFTFPSDVRHWPKYCRECQGKRKTRK